MSGIKTYNKRPDPEKNRSPIGVLPVQYKSYMTTWWYVRITADFVTKNERKQTQVTPVQ